MTEKYIKERFDNIFTHNKDVNNEIKKIYKLEKNYSFDFYTSSPIKDRWFYSSSIKYMFDNINKSNIDSYRDFTYEKNRLHRWFYFKESLHEAIKSISRGIKENDLRYNNTIKINFFDELYNFMVFINYEPFLNHIKKSKVSPYSWTDNCPRGFSLSCPCSGGNYHKKYMQPQDLVGTYIGLYYIPTEILAGDYARPNNWNCGIGLRTDDKPYEYIGIYLTYMSIIKNLNLKNFISIENYTFNTQLEESKIPKMYIASEKELDIEYSGYKLEKYELNNDKIIYIYSKECKYY